MKKKMGYLVLIFMIGGIFIYQTLVIRKQSKLVYNLSGSNAKLTHNLGKLKGNFIAAWQLERATFLSDRIYDEEGKEIEYKFLTRTHPKLIFRFSKVDCSKCVVEQINLIRELIKNKDIEYMMVCDYTNKRNLGLFKRTNAITNTVYNCEKMLKDEKKTPFFCIYDKGIVTDVFFPDSDFPDMTNKYFKEISTKYFASKDH